VRFVGIALMLKLKRATSQQLTWRVPFSKRAVNSYYFKRSLLAASYLLLIVAAVYVSVDSSLSHMSTGDQYDSAYPVQSWHPGAYLTFFARHTNLMKLPILWAQARLFPYDIHNYVITNIVAATFVLWSFFVSKLVKGPMILGAVNFALAGILLASFDFSKNLVEPTIRNIEYPIALGYLLLIRSYMKRPRRSTWIYSAGILAMLVASDYFFLYSVPVAVVGAVTMIFRRGYITKTLATRLLANSVVGAIGGLAILKLLEEVGFLHLLHNSQIIIPYSGFWGQIQNCLVQILRIFGGNFFGLPVGGEAGGRILLSIVAVSSMVVAFRLLLQGTDRLNNSREKQRAFVIYSMAFLFFVTLAAYVFSGFATSYGENIRYISILPFVGVLLIAVQFEHYEKTLLLGAVVVLAVGIYLTPITNRAFSYERQQSTAWVNLDKGIVSYLENQHVSVGYGTLGYASTTWFFSHEKINIYNIQPCNIKNPVLSDSYWYNKPGSKRSALIVDRSVAAVWTDESWVKCSESKLSDIYGKPLAEKTIGMQRGLPIEVYIYNYDIGARLKD
jgi:hypothetical protein